MLSTPQQFEQIRDEAWKADHVDAMECRTVETLIENVVTHREHRNKGWGKAVLKHALAHAWSAGCYKVMLLTGRKEESVFRFYEGAGFSRHGKQAFVARAEA